MEIADHASGIKLSKEILTAILSEDTQEFTLDPGADPTKPQLKTVSVQTEPKPDDRGWYAIKVTLKF